MQIWFLNVMPKNGIGVLRNKCRQKKKRRRKRYGVSEWKREKKEEPRTV
jgi:hypothetical protein